MKKITIILLLSIIYSIHAFPASFRHLSVKDGLSSRQTFRITKDRDGFIWIFTHLGVNRYDGNEIREYKLDLLEAKDHILSYTIMTCDKQGNLWLSLKNGKLFSYNRQTDAFVLEANLQQSLGQAVVLNDIMFDDDNHLWLCLSTGIYHFDQTGKQAVAAGMPGEYVNRLIQMDNGNFIAGTNTHLFELKKNNKETALSVVKRLNTPIGIRTESLYSIGHKLFVGTFSDGAFMIDTFTGNISSFDQFIPPVPVRAISSMADGSLLFGTDGSGLYRLDVSKDLLIEHYNTDEDDDSSLCGNTVSDVFVDERNCIWVSTSTNGVSILDPDNPDIHWVRHGYSSSNSLISSHVNAVLEDSEGDLWYGTNNGVSLYQPASDKWTHFLDNKQNVSGHSPVVIALCEDKNKNIWAGGYGIGVYRINKQNKKAEKIKGRGPNESHGIPTEYIYSIYAEGDYIWFGGIEGEYARYNLQDNTYTYYPIDCIGDIKPGKDNTLLIAACNGLGIFDKASGNINWIHAFGDVALRYPVRCLLQTKAGDIWMASDGDGLICFNPKTNRSDAITINDGLDSNSINSLVEDNDGRIWFNTEKRLYCLETGTRKLFNMNEFLYIEGGFYNPNTAIRLKKGDLVFGTAEGAVRFSPDFNFEQKIEVRLVFTDFKMLYQSVKAGVEGSVLKQALDETSGIKLKYAQNSFSIAFSAINFIHPHKVKYEYKLENFNSEWQQTDNARQVDYMNLSPGKYTFRLKAIDRYSQEELAERSIEISIGRPFWWSWWAFLTYIIVLSMLVFFIYQFARHKIKEYNSKEKIRSFISIAHDIRTPIALIKAPLGELQAQEGIPEQSKKSLAVASKNAEKLFNMVTQLLDLQKADLQPEKLTVAKHNIYSFMEEKVTDFRMSAIQKNIDLRLEIEPGIQPLCFDKGKMHKAMDNLLSNALKYTEEGSISLIVRQARNNWSIEIHDTGIGIPAQDQKNMFGLFYRAGNAISSNETGSGIGLLLVKRIIKQHHGTISFSSIENQGTSFIISIPKKIKGAIMIEEEEADFPEPESERQNRLTPAQKKNVLLLAEDDDDMREYLTDNLSQEYEVVSTTDGGKALELAKEINPDMIISDVIMPVLQGYEMCRILKSSIETSHIPIILLTALSERENVIQGLEAGANDYIIKPFDFSVLKVRLRNILQSRQHLRESVLSAEISELEETDYASQLDKEFLDKAMDIITTELANPEFSINDFCRMLGMSRTSGYNKIKSLTGQTPSDLIRIVRLNKSKELLATKRYIVGEVSNMVGFSDAKYFSTVFKKQFGISPSKLV